MKQNSKKFAVLLMLNIFSACPFLKLSKQTLVDQFVTEDDKYATNICKA